MWVSAKFPVEKEKNPLYKQESYYLTELVPLYNRTFKNKSLNSLSNTNTFIRKRQEIYV